jgi:hypothetical protein
MSRYILAMPGDWCLARLDDGTDLHIDPVIVHEYMLAIVNLHQLGTLTKATAAAAQRSRFGPADSSDAFVGRVLHWHLQRHSREAYDAIVALYADVPEANA